MHDTLAQWPFVIATYALGMGGTAALVAQSWWAMRGAERRRDQARGQ